MAKKYNSIKKFYPYYLSLHKNKYCRRLHFLGQWVTLVFLVFIIYSSRWILVFLLPFIIYPFAWGGHYFFEKNKPAAFNKPIYSKICDWIMFKDILTGKIKI